MITKRWIASKCLQFRSIVSKHRASVPCTSLMSTESCTYHFTCAKKHSCNLSSRSTLTIKNPLLLWLLVKLCRYSNLSYTTSPSNYTLSFTRFRAKSALSTPSWNPMALAKALASSNLFLASLIFPSISANSPKLCVATAQPTSHSSFRSGGVILDAKAIAFSDQRRAFCINTGREAAGALEGGSCWAREMERLFTGLD